MFIKLLSAASVLAVAGCTTSGPVGETAAGGDCAALYENLDKAVDAASAQDGGWHRVDGYPGFRVNRFLASFRNELGDGPKRRQWLKQLNDLDSVARMQEVTRLPIEQQPGVDDLARQLTECGEQRVENLMADAERFRRFAKQAEVPDDYSGWRRTLGLYPITRLPVLYGVNQWHDEAKAEFKAPHRGSVRYVPTMDAPAVDTATPISSNNPLAMPAPDSATLDRLWSRYAPIINVDARSDADYIGRVKRRGDKVFIDTNEPTVYRYLSYTRVGGETLLQLNYQWWFPERPADGVLNLYGGLLDGLIWRVTLLKDGSPLLFDSIHPCGCYYMAFPHSWLKARDTGFWDEPILTLGRAPKQFPVTLELAPSTHYLVGLKTMENASDSISGSPYRIEPYQKLLLMYDGERHRSLFGADGIADGTERAEQYLLWPMGVKNAGAMRQRGRHATAFVGTRHFDDPFLIEDLFVVPAELLK